MPLITTNRLPPSGWVYQQPGTGFMPQNRMSPFSDVVREILAHRTANKLERATVQNVADDLDTYTCNRLGNDPAWCNSLQKKNYSANLFKRTPQDRAGAAHAVAEAVKNLPKPDVAPV